jgi:hypothetical protein
MKASADAEDAIFSDDDQTDELSQMMDTGSTVYTSSAPLMSYLPLPTASFTPDPFVSA